MKPKTKPGKLVTIYDEIVEFGVSVIGFFVKGKEVINLHESFFEKDNEGNIILPEFFQKADGYSKYKRDEKFFYLSRKGQLEKYTCSYTSSFVNYYNTNHELCEVLDGKFIPVQNTVSISH